MNLDLMIALPITIIDTRICLLFDHRGRYWGKSDVRGVSKLDLYLNRANESCGGIKLYVGKYTLTLDGGSRLEFENDDGAEKC